MIKNKINKKSIIPAGLYALVATVVAFIFFVSDSIVMYKADLLKMLLVIAATAVVMLIKPVRIKNKYIIWLEIALLILYSYGVHTAIWKLNRFYFGPELKWTIANLIIILGIVCVVYGICTNLAATAVITGILFYVWAVTDYYVYQFRGVVLLPADIVGVKTAMDVVGGYTFEIYKEELFWLLVAIWFFTLLLKIKKKENTKRINIKKHLCFAATGILLMVFSVFIAVLMKAENNMYRTSEVYKEQGMIISFANYGRFLFAKKPEGYSIDKLNEVADATAKDGLNRDYLSNETPDNIIVIMNESFTDFSTVGSLPEIDECLTNFNKLRETSTNGNTYVPVFGGSTVNSEYEFLTGNSIGFQSGMPLTSNVNSLRPSIAWYLSEQGYKTMGMHLGAATNWNRQTAYKFLGLEDTVYLDNVESENPDKFYHTVSDEWNYNKLIELYENCDSDKFFMFNVTIQNHGGYEDRKDLKSENVVDLSAYGDFPMAETYLTCLRESDVAFKNLTDYFKAQDKKTMIVMFGDHHPKIEDSFYEYLYGKKLEELSAKENLGRYVTPFIVWTNYDMEKKEYEQLSANYLGELVLELSGIELPPYYEYLRSLREKYPVLSLNGVIDNTGTYHSLTDMENEEDILNYRYFEYNSANDSKPQFELFGMQD